MKLNKVTFYLCSTRPVEALFMKKKTKLISIASTMEHFQRRIVGQRRVCSGHVSDQVAPMIKSRED
jgi:hypothetical protein